MGRHEERLRRLEEWLEDFRNRHEPRLACIVITADGLYHYFPHKGADEAEVLTKEQMLASCARPPKKFYMSCKDKDGSALEETRKGRGVWDFCR